MSSFCFPLVVLSPFHSCFAVASSSFTPVSSSNCHDCFVLLSRCSWSLYHRCRHFVITLLSLPHCFTIVLFSPFHRCCRVVVILSWFSCSPRGLSSLRFCGLFGHNNDAIQCTLLWGLKACPRKSSRVPIQKLGKT